MRRLTKYVNLIKYSFQLAMLATALLIFVCVPAIGKYEEEGTNFVSVFVNGVQVGTVKDAYEVNDMVLEARKRLARQSDELVLVDCNLVLSGSKDVLAVIDEREAIVDKIYEVLKDNVMKTKQPAYAVKIKDFTINLKSIDDVIALLNASKKEYDADGVWDVRLVTDTSRELDVYTTRIVKRSDEDQQVLDTPIVFPKAGAYLEMEELYNAAYNKNKTNNYEFGVLNIGFDETIEVVKAYVDVNTISSLEDAIEAVTKTQEKSKVYEVVSGDTLGVIAQKNDMSVSDILSLNTSTIPTEDTMLRIGDLITIYSPEPELSIVRTERKYYEESYEAEPIVEYMDDWYTTRTEIVQQPVAGFRKVVADVKYRNAELIGTDVLYENVVAEAVPKIVKKGTKTPPTYMYPVSGRISSSFGKRKAPKKGASTYHKGIDFAVPIGTAVMASSGGTVIRAGWGSGYGYCVYIQHPDGKVTRYGHLSKVLVKNGQDVSQGQKIALSGNTGISTGPHLHFEILVGGGQVNPLNYIK